MRWGADDLAAQRLARVVGVLRGDEPSTVMGEARLLTRQGFAERAWQKVGDIQFRTPSLTGRYDPLFDLCSGLLLHANTLEHGSDGQIMSDCRRRSEQVRALPFSLTDPPGQVPQTAFLRRTEFDDRPLMVILMRSRWCRLSRNRSATEFVRIYSGAGRSSSQGFFMQHTIWRYTQGLIQSLLQPA